MNIEYCMNTRHWANWLKKNYPEAKRIVANTAHGTVELDHGYPLAQELIAELEPGRVVAVIERSKPHFHLWITERYSIIKGTLALIVDGALKALLAESAEERLKLWRRPDRFFDLEEMGIPKNCGIGTSQYIEPLEVHHAIAIGEPAVVEVRSTPAWSPEDHFEV